MSRYRVQIEPPAWNDINALPVRDALRIFDVIESLESEPRPNGVKKLKGGEFYRVRAGDFRIVYDIQDGALIVLIVKVGNRREVYKNR